MEDYREEDDVSKYPGTLRALLNFYVGCYYIIPDYSWQSTLYACMHACMQKTKGYMVKGL